MTWAHRGKIARDPRLADEEGRREVFVDGFGAMHPVVIGDAMPGVDSSVQSLLRAYQSAWSQAAAKGMVPTADEVWQAQAALNALNDAVVDVQSAGQQLDQTRRGTSEGQRWRHRRLAQAAQTALDLFFKGAKRADGAPVKAAPLVPTSIGPSADAPFGGYVATRGRGVRIEGDSASVVVSGSTVPIVGAADMGGGGQGDGVGGGAAVAEVAKAVVGVMELISAAVIREDDPVVAYRRARNKWGQAMQGLDRTLKEYNAARQQLKNAKRKPQWRIRQLENKVERIRTRTRGIMDINSPGLRNTGNVVGWRRMAVKFWDVLAGFDVYRNLFDLAAIMGLNRPLESAPTDMFSPAKLKMMFPQAEFRVDVDRGVAPFPTRNAALTSALRLNINGILPDQIVLPLWVYGLSVAQQRELKYPIGPTIGQIREYIAAQGVKASDVMGAAERTAFGREVSHKGATVQSEQGPVKIHAASAVTALLAMRLAEAIGKSAQSIQSWAFTQERQRRGIPVLPGQGPGGGILKVLSEQTSIIPKGSVWSVGGFGGETAMLDKDGLLPLRDPRFNMREVCKQLILLEQHLTDPRRQCPDCIGKHLMCAEGLAEEAAMLDGNGELGEYPARVAAQIRVLAAATPQTDPRALARAVRNLRKNLAGHFAWPSPANLGAQRRIGGS